MADKKINKPAELTEEQFRNLISNCAGWIREVKTLRASLDSEDTNVSLDLKTPFFHIYDKLLQELRNVEAAIHVTSKYLETEVVTNDLIDAYKIGLSCLSKVRALLSQRIESFSTYEPTEDKQE